MERKQTLERCRCQTVTIVTTVPTTTINEVINAYQSEADWQENQTFNAPNSCIFGTEEATIEKSNTNDNIDDREKVLNPTHTESETKLDLKPKVQTQHTPTTIGPCTSHQLNNTQSQPKPVPTKTTWVKIPRDKQSSPNDVLMIERKHKRSDESEEGGCPTEKVLVPYEESPEAYPTMVAARQPR